MNNEKSDKLNEALLLCTIHSERMNFAWGKIKTHFPLDREEYSRLKPEELSFIDQLIFRFSKMQDSMGEKLFPPKSRFSFFWPSQLTENQPKIYDKIAI